MTDYMPTIKTVSDGRVLQLMDYAGTCICEKPIYVKAKCLERKTKLFTKWNDENYMTGKVGDYLTVRGEKDDVLTIIDGEMFTGYYCDIKE